MPLHCTIDPEQALVTIVSEGDVTRADFESVVDAVDAADAHGYRKLFDGVGGQTRMTHEDILSLGIRMRSHHEKGPVGPLAAVIPEDYTELASRLLGILASANRPMRLFREAKSAHRWLQALAE